ncbi:putative nuclease HARBI1 [Hypomesus transpacificus]|uniref:putative nuclease HARBI1 n=1 Tax=Hypomesus transpacificus TaxID=137520 RepID=UPI001F074031|nr:putative nuclease HARBI1 [Hypomesus transpacificus]
METNRRALVTVAIGSLYLKAEEEAAELRQLIQRRRARMRRMRMARLRQMLSLIFLNDGTPQNYAQVNDQVPILKIVFSDEDTKPAFKLARATIQLLVQVLPRKKRHGWSHEMEVFMFVYWLACGASYRVTSNAFSMPVATVCRAVHHVVEEMMTILHRIIHFPKADEMEGVGAGFVHLAGHEAFCFAAGAIDGCRIKIRPPARPLKKSHLNRKLFPIVILQGICDSRGKFIDVHIGNTGSVHDALVLRSSPMFKESLYPPAGYFLLGDGGYPCLQNPVAVITPFRQPIAGSVEARFNSHHAKASCVIERTFGILKTRWRSIFLRGLEVRPLFVPKVVAACCVLHNVCLSVNDILEVDHPQHEEEGDNLEDCADEQEVSGNNLRARLAAHLSAPTELNVSLQEHDYI